MAYSFFVRLAVIVARCKVPDSRDFKLATCFGIIILPIVVSQVSE